MNRTATIGGYSMEDCGWIRAIAFIAVRAWVNCALLPVKCSILAAARGESALLGSDRICRIERLSLCAPAG